MRSVLIACLLLLPAVASAHHTSGTAKKSATAKPVSFDMGPIHHGVTTRSAEAQAAFDRGLALVFAFNHDEAVRSFRQALARDPDLAMAHWGIALASGPNINLPMDEDHAKLAWEEVGKARALAARASEPERAYIDALAKRYSADPKADRTALDVAYRDAMRSLHARYPDDMDAAVLFAEAAMDLKPWKLWTLDGRPAEGTEEIVSVLEEVLKREPNHTGANHYYIHAVEASPHPERALGSAQRLRTLAPGAGHLVHMPTHIYGRLGDHLESARLNDKAAEVDRRYIAAGKVEGVYPMMYYSHNLQFSAYSYGQVGHYAESMRSARQLADHARPMVSMMPMIEGVVPTSIVLQVQFGRWDEILAAKDPGDSFPITRATWRLARGFAEAAKGRVPDAEKELAAYREAGKAVKPEVWFGLNPPDVLLGIGDHMLLARIAEAKQDRKGAIEELKKAVDAEDRLYYNEPPEWMLHARPALGGVLLRDGQLAEAEKVFRKDLEAHPRNARSLFGLAEALRGQGQAYESGLVKREFDSAWKEADTKLTVASL